MRQAKIRYLFLLVWLVPLSFALTGYWPVGLGLAILVTVWALGAGSTAGGGQAK